MKEIPIKSYPIKKKDVRTYFIVFIIVLSLGISLLLLILIFPYTLPFLGTSIFSIGWGLVGIVAYYINPEKLYLISISYWKRKKYRKQREQLLGKGFFMDCLSCGKNFKNQNFNYCPYCGSLL